MKIYIIAGEASGDLHASNLIRAIKATNPDIEIRGWGGDLMEQAGMELVKHYRDTAVMGLINVLLKLQSIKENLEACKQDIALWKPDLMVFVDYPGFNLRIAEYTKKLGLTNYFYIAPKVWASREKRIEKIRAYVDKVFAILPFEENYFTKHGIPVSYVGNPVVDALDERTCKKETREAFLVRNGFGDKPIIALLAGSRDHEVKQILPYFLEVAQDYPNIQFVIAAVSVLNPKVYTDIIRGEEIAMVVDDTYALLQHAHLALVASGTATLETALLNVPQIVCYRLWGNHLTQFVMDWVVKVPYVSLVNLILNREVVPELIQKKLTVLALKTHFSDLLNKEEQRRSMLESYGELRTMLGGPGASEKAAEEILKAFACRETINR